MLAVPCLGSEVMHELAPHAHLQQLAHFGTSCSHSLAALFHVVWGVHYERYVIYVFHVQGHTYITYDCVLCIHTYCKCSCHQFGGHIK